MTLVSLTLPNDGETIDASDVNNPFNDIASVLNGNIDDQNINTISGTKVTSGTLPQNAFTSSALLAMAQGWSTGPNSPTSVTYNGGGSYSLVFSGDQTGTYSNGMWLRTTRSVAAPTQCTSVDGVSQYWVKTSPNKMTFTDDFVVSVWIKLLTPVTGANVIIGRFNGTSGWRLAIAGDHTVSLGGFNGGTANFSRVDSVQSIPLGQWVHITAQLDMSSFTASPTTSYIMINGNDVPCTVSRSGTNPIALVQAGNLEIGAYNGGTNPIGAKIAQVAVFSAKVAQATARGYISQGLSGSETNLASAYSFNNSTADLNTTTPNDLVGGAGSPNATNADSPFGTQGSGAISSTLDYASITNVVFSTNTTVTAVVKSGNTIPTTGGVSAIHYSVSANPYGAPLIPASKLDWGTLRLGYASITTVATSTAAIATPSEISGLAVPFVLSETRRVRATLFSASWYNSGANYNRIYITNGAVVSANSIGYISTAFSTGSQELPCTVIAEVTLPPGAYTFRVGMGRNTGTASLSGASGSPAYLAVDIVG